MTRTRADLAQLKLKAFEILKGNPDIACAEMARRIGISLPTSYRYKKEYNAMVDATTLRIAKEVDERTREGGSIFLIIKKFLRIK